MRFPYVANGLWNLKDDMASSGHARGPLRMAQSASARGQQRAADAGEKSPG